ncbi:hypothetical protein ACFQ1E_03580 [Sphingomonas canadensis]|uniref:Lipoprotein n=1 Tax=Sphingomonas canadensis TaxID=1219257 RepID=A0ABW3H219_9SPHN|nr:hypothetical protein [Sphingomonas canadensis]MCW3834677.1 hypothetical protein [Sphingomonas canadensis]
MKFGYATATAMAAILALSACGGGATGGNASNATAPAGNAAAPAAPAAQPSAPASAAPAAAAAPVAGDGEAVQKIESCVLETPKGHYDGPCERVEWGGPSFSIRRAGNQAFLDGITEVVVEVDIPGEKAGGSYRRGEGGDLVPTGPLSFRDDCACWVRPDFRVGAQAM